MKRRTLLASAAATTAMLFGYRANGDAAPEPDQRIMLIRHAEKPPPNGTPYGITAAGVRDFKALTTDGWQRAGALVELFAPSTGAVRPGLSRPTTIFGTRPSTANESLRPTETVTPTAQRLGLTVTQTFAFQEEAALAKALLATPGASLTAWQHQHIPLITQELGLAHLGVPKIWPGVRFDMVFVFTRRGRTWSFAQVPQLLLAGDIAAPFSANAASGTDD